MGVASAWASAWVLACIPLRRFLCRRGEGRDEVEDPSGVSGDHDVIHDLAGFGIHDLDIGNRLAVRVNLDLIIDHEVGGERVELELGSGPALIGELLFRLLGVLDQLRFIHELSTIGLAARKQAVDQPPSTLPPGL